MAKKKDSKLIEELKNQLIEDNVFTSKDLLLFQLLSNANSLYTDAIDKVKDEGSVISYLDDNRNERTKLNPYYTIALEQSKEIFKYINSMYSTPASRKALTNNIKEEIDPFTDLQNQMKEMDK